MNGDDVPTGNIYYDGGTTTLLSSYAKPMAKAAGVGNTVWSSAINDAGYVLCEAPTATKPNGWVDDTTAGSNATTYDQDIPSLVAGQASFPTALNNIATPQVVGYANAVGGGTHAFIWTFGAATATDLNAYASGLPGITGLSGWTFNYADGINKNGEIVGFGTYGGTTHAFALLDYTPEPLSFVLLAAALLGLLAYAWRKRK